MKLKSYLIGAIVLIFVGLLITTNVLWKKYQIEKAERLRLYSNNMQLMAEGLQNTSLILSKEEFNKTLSDSLKSVLKRLELPLKTIIKIEEKRVFIHDTVNKPVYVERKGKDTWKILDREKCWMWEGLAKLDGDSLMVNRVGFDYQNKTTDIFSRKLKFKFLFIRFYSKKEFTQNSISECGSSTSRTITIK